MLGRWYRTTFQATKQTISMSSHHIVKTIPRHLRQDAEHACRLPWPTERGHHEQRRVALRQSNRRRPPIVDEHHERRQVVGTAAERLAKPRARALERSEVEEPIPIVFEEELVQAIAELADAVVKDEVRSFGGRLALWVHYVEAVSVPEAIMTHLMLATIQAMRRAYTVSATVASPGSRSMSSGPIAHRSLLSQE